MKNIHDVLLYDKDFFGRDPRKSRRRFQKHRERRGGYQFLDDDELIAGLEAVRRRVAR